MSNQSNFDKVEAVVKAYDDYVSLLVEEINELVSISSVHGWQSHRYKKGKEARAKIVSALSLLSPVSPELTVLSDEEIFKKIGKSLKQFLYEHEDKNGMIVKYDIDDWWAQLAHTKEELKGEK